MQLFLSEAAHNVLEHFEVSVEFSACIRIISRRMACKARLSFGVCTVGFRLEGLLALLCLGPTKPGHLLRRIRD